MRRLTMVAAIAALGLMAGACGGGSDSGTTTIPPAGTTPAVTSPAASPSETATTSENPPASSELSLKDNVFDPADFTIAAGAEITLMNTGSALHNFSIEGQDIDKDVNPGETETEDLELAPGTYTMFCKYHRALGMEGTLTVTG